MNKDQLLSHDVDLLKFNEIIKTDFLIDVEINKMIKDNQLKVYQSFERYNGGTIVQEN